MDEISCKSCGKMNFESVMELISHCQKFGHIPNWLTK